MLLCKDPRFPELKAFSDTFQEITEASESVIIFGANKVQQTIAKEILRQNIAVKAFIDNNDKFKEKSFLGIPVMKPDNYPDTSSPVVIATSKYYTEIMTQLKKLGFSKLLPYAALMDSESKAYDHSVIRANIKRFLHGFDSGLHLDSIDFVTTEKCSLRCRDCSNLMQYFITPQNSDPEELKAAFKKLYSAVDYIYEVRVLGGEPLVDRNLEDYLHFLETFDNVGGIVILTNGTIPFSDSLLSILKNPCFSVRISDYGLMEQKIGRLSESLERAGAIYSVYEPTDWLDCGKIEKSNRSIDDNKTLFSQCCMKNSLSIKNGSLWLCPFAGNVSALNALPAGVDQCLDLLDEKISSTVLRQRIVAFLKLPYLKVCDYCPGRPFAGENIVPAAIQLSKPLLIDL